LISTYGFRGVINTDKFFSTHSYAISDEELKLGIRSLAVPVPVAGSAGEFVAAVSVSASSARVRAADLSKRFLPVLQSCRQNACGATTEAN
jgi:IclR family pca regulon transcriptional regulator